MRILIINQYYRKPRPNCNWSPKVRVCHILENGMLTDVTIIHHHDDSLNELKKRFKCKEAWTLGTKELTVREFNSMYGNK